MEEGIKILEKFISKYNEFKNKTGIAVLTIDRKESNRKSNSKK